MVKASDRNPHAMSGIHETRITNNPGSANEIDTIA